MSNGDIQFDTDTQSRPQQTTTTPKLVQWVMKYSHGMIKDETQANYVLLGFVVLAIATSVFLSFREAEKPYQPSQEEILRAMTPPSPGTM